MSPEKVLGTIQQLPDSTGCDPDSAQRTEHLCNLSIYALQGHI